jgi:hypothetical protein
VRESKRLREKIINNHKGRPRMDGNFPHWSRCITGEGRGREKKRHPNPYIEFPKMETIYFSKFV